MKLVKQRTLMILLLVLALLVGTVIYCARYITQGSDWAAFPSNQHAFTDGSIASGQILDRNGTLLFDAASGAYAEDGTVRKATLHAVGDPDGNIATGARSAFLSDLVGWNAITGTTGSGHKLYLTVDAALNQLAYQELGSRKGTVAVYNYETGEILCMVSTPTFDPENIPDIRDGDTAYEGVYMNRFLSSTFTPGSVFKVVTTAAAIDNLPDVFDRTFTCTGRITIGDDTITCPHAHGTMNFYDAFANSCNCAYAQLAVEMGGDTLAQYANTAGLLDSQNISGITTAAGSFDVGEAGSPQLGWSGVGQYDDLINPCSFMTLMGAIGNDGIPVTPRIIKKETTMAGLPVSNPGKDTGSRIWSQKTCETVKEMMANNVAEVYGQSNFGDLKLCAKSGTAEVGTASPHSWFAGFLDDTAHPYAFVVLVENGGGGATVAGSIASRVLQAAVAK